MINKQYMIKNLINSVNTKDNAQAKLEFKKVMAEKVLNRIEQLKIEFGSKIYNK